MPRFNVHLTITDDSWGDSDPVITVTVNATNEDIAELFARALMRTDLDYDVCEIELAEETEHGDA